MSRRILIVDDESQIRRFLRISLQANGFETVEARSGEEAISICARQTPDLVVLDLGLPDMDGIGVIRRLREWTAVPILVLSVRWAETEKVLALDSGANDYLTKPFGISELLARIRVIFRDAGGQDEEQAVLEIGALRVDRLRRQVTLGGTPVHLSPKEYALLNHLINKRGQVLTHQHLLREIWGEHHAGDTHYLRILVAHLRQKLMDDPSHPRYIVTEPGVGYRFKPEATEQP